MCRWNEDKLTLGCERSWFSTPKNCPNTIFFLGRADDVFISSAFRLLGRAAGGHGPEGRGKSSREAEADFFAGGRGDPLGSSSAGCLLFAEDAVGQPEELDESSQRGVIFVGEVGVPLGTSNT